MPDTQPTKSILITGCSTGIGYDAAHGMRAQGWRVFAACRKPEDCARLLDYTDEDSIHAALAEVLAATGGTLDALFNNGAYGLPGAVEDLPTEGLRHIFETNFFGWHTLTRAVIPVMRVQGSGRIVQCSSVLGIVSIPWRGAYNATKFALEGLTDTLRIEMRGSGIHICLIEPGSRPTFGSMRSPILSAGLTGKTPPAPRNIATICANGCTNRPNRTGLNCPPRPSRTS